MSEPLDQSGANGREARIRRADEAASVAHDFIHGLNDVTAGAPREGSAASAPEWNGDGSTGKFVKSSSQAELTLAQVTSAFIVKARDKYGLGRFYPDELPLLNEMARLAQIELGPQPLSRRKALVLGFRDWRDRMIDWITRAEA